ncbi:hypothetical protein NDR87_31465 [Nocardia sp. CDC159]|uniref:LtfC/p132/Gp6 beta-sandwich domain-containing protein n=1 Tax=Nocardia pulmonis TaxID=2951408 RepID=A0A9X2EGJ7_9NOCA|nr:MULTISPECIES: hypothetical protein [Nocardia]MCM6777931.1 hypothetical protein [Nocardia pulmonis]MCM6790898.1 hypothetical protein [Nocardia sp. CDC159]
MTLTLGWTAGTLRLTLQPGATFTGRVEYQSPPGTPAPWPPGLSAWLRITVPGSTFERIWPADIDGAVMSWSVQPDDVNEIPLNAHGQLWLDYQDAAPLVWLEGPVLIGSCHASGFGYVAAVPLPDSGAVAVPVPGPPGPPGPPGSGAGTVIVTGTAGAALSGHRAVVQLPDGTYVYASCDDPTHMALPIGITAAAAMMGDQVQIVMFGQMTESSWAWTPGPVFLGIGGSLTQSAPTGPTAAFLTQLAAATAADTVFVDRLPSIALT